MKTITMLTIAVVLMGCSNHNQKRQSKRVEESDTAIQRVRTPAPVRQSVHRKREPVKATRPEKIAKVKPKAKPKPKPKPVPVAEIDLGQWSISKDDKNAFMCSNIVSNMDTEIVLALTVKQNDEILIVKRMSVKLKGKVAKPVKIPFKEPMGKYYVSVVTVKKNL